MPEIRDLLRDAAPSARPYDEERVRGRVDARRRRRRMVTGGGGLAAVLLVIVAVIAFNDPGDPGETVVAQPAPTAGGKVAGVTAAAFVHDDLWIGDETGAVGPESERGRFAMPGPVRDLETGDALWAVGDTWVAAIDPVEGTDLGVWGPASAVADIQPLEGQHVAISLPDDDSVAIVRVSAEGLEEIERIPVGDSPGNLVLTLGNDLWVNDGDVICRIDWGAGGAVDEQGWSGALLAPSATGGIWAVDGDRVVDLDPMLLSQGQSVAIGARYDFPDAALAVTTPTGLYVGGPSGIARFDANDQMQLPITEDAAVAMASDGESLVWVANGTVTRFDVRAASAVADEVPIDDLEAVALAFLRNTFGWTDAVADEGSQQAEDLFTVVAHSPSLGRDVGVMIERTGDDWEVVRFDTASGDRADEGWSISLGRGDDFVYFAHAESELVPELTVSYGDQTTVHGAAEATVNAGSIEWRGDLGFVADTPGWVQMVFRNADGVVLEGWRTSVPAGPYSVG